MSKKEKKKLILALWLLSALSSVNVAYAATDNLLNGVSFQKTADNNIELSVDTKKPLPAEPKIFENTKNSYFIVLDATDYKGAKNIDFSNVKDNIKSVTIEYVPYKRDPSTGYTGITIETLNDTTLSIADTLQVEKNQPLPLPLKIIMGICGTLALVGGCFMEYYRVKRNRRNKINIDNLLDVEDAHSESTDYNKASATIDSIYDSVDFTDFKSETDVDTKEDVINNEVVNSEEFVNDTQEIDETPDTIGENMMYPSPDDIVNDILANDEVVSELSEVVKKDIEEKEEYTSVEDDEQIDEIFDNLDNDDVASTDTNDDIIQDENVLDDMFDEYNANDENEESSQEIIEAETVEIQENINIVNNEVVDVTDNVAEFEGEEEVEETSADEVAEEEIIAGETVDEDIEEDNDEKADDGNADFKSVQYVPNSGMSTFTPKTISFSAPAPKQEEVVDEVVDEDEQTEEIIEIEQTVQEDNIETANEVFEDEQIIEQPAEEDETTDEYIEEEKEEVIEITQPETVEEKIIEISQSEDESADELKAIIERAKQEEDINELEVVINTPDSIVANEEIVEDIEPEPEPEEEPQTVTDEQIEAISDFLDEADLEEEDLPSEFNIGGLDGILGEAPDLDNTVLSDEEVNLEQDNQEEQNEQEEHEELVEIDEMIDNNTIEEIIDETLNKPEVEEVEQEEVAEVVDTTEVLENNEEVEEDKVETAQYYNETNTEYTEDEDMSEDTPIATENFFVESDEEEDVSEDFFKEDYAYVAEQSNDNDDIFFDEEDETENMDDSEPIVVSQKEIENNKVLYLIRHLGSYSLIGTMNEDVYVIHKFEEKPVKTRINIKLNESKANQKIYIIKIDTWRALVSVTDTSMDNLLTLS